MWEQSRRTVAVTMHWRLDRWTVSLNLQICELTLCGFSSLAKKQFNILPRVYVCTLVVSPDEQRVAASVGQKCAVEIQYFHLRSMKKTNLSRFVCLGRKILYLGGKFVWHIVFLCFFSSVSVWAMKSKDKRMLCNSWGALRWKNKTVAAPFLWVWMRSKQWNHLMRMLTSTWGHSAVPLGQGIGHGLAPDGAGAV